jgi:cell division protein FtsI/penicillin-binding protein 2
MALVGVRRRMRMRGRLTIAAGVALAGWLGAALLPATGDGEAEAASVEVSQGPPALAEPTPAAPPTPSAPPASRPEPRVAANAPLQHGRFDPLLLGPPAAREVFHDLRIVEDGLEREVSTASGSVRLRYTLDAALSERVWKLLAQGRFALAHVVVLDPKSGAVLAYASTDPVRFPPQKTYPAASLVKVITAAATLDRAPNAARETCRYVGSPWRLTRDRLKAPARGNATDMRRALATSNNQCFARWAVHRVGPSGLLGAIDRFGMLTAPALGHPGGRADDPGDDPLALGELGSGLDGLEITPLHAAQLAATLAEGRLVEPRWLEAAWDDSGRSVAVPRGTAGRQVLTPELAARLRGWLVDTTVRGTARRAFRARGGRPLLPGISVAGKTGSLNGSDPKGHYEWFIGVAPAGDPKLAVATVAVQGQRWWWSASQLAAEVLRAAFCPEGRCHPDAVDRLLPQAPSLRGARSEPQASEGTRPAAPPVVPASAPEAQH